MLRVLLTPGYLTLRNQLRFSSEQERLRTYLFAVGGLVFWVSLFAFFWYVLSIFQQVEIFGVYLVRKLLSILLLSLFSLLCFSNLISALSSYYLSDDLMLIHSLPLSIRQIHLSRFVLTFMNSSWMMVIFGLPVFLAYGVVFGAGWLYYGVLLVFLIPYLAIPTGVGVGVATLLVTLLPARRTRDLMVLVSLFFVVGLFLLLRYVQPERLVRADTFSDVMVFLGQLQSPGAVYLPSHWGTEVLMPLLTGEVGEPWLYLALTLTSGVAAVILSTWLSLGLYARGFTRAQQVEEATDRRPGWLDRALLLATAPLPKPMAAIILKDIKTFIRDAAEWPQLLLILALVVVYLYSVKVLPLDGPFVTLRIHNLISFLNLAMVGFVVSSVAVRFLFTSVSVEGRAFWLLRAAPLEPMRLLLAKFVVGVPLLLGLGLILVVASNLLLGVTPLLMGLGVFTISLLSFSLAGLSVGIGARYPNFKAENVAKIAAGPGGIFFMIVSQLFVATVLALLAPPAYLLVRAEFRQSPLMLWEWAIVVGLVGAAIGVNILGTVLPLRRGAESLRELT